MVVQLLIQLLKSTVKYFGLLKVLKVIVILQKLKTLARSRFQHLQLMLNFKLIQLFQMQLDTPGRLMDTSFM